MAVVKRIEEAGTVTNVLWTIPYEFLGHIIDKEGISADPDKIKVLTEMVEPSNITKLRVLNLLGKFSPNLIQPTEQK